MEYVFERTTKVKRTSKVCSDYQEARKQYVSNINWDIKHDRVALRYVLMIRDERGETILEWYEPRRRKPEEYE